ncbi:hypothetical protein [Saezia sanguinis]|uniref:hypothetical protein n=1 Tax=Saezia sanguinis TaxID=1965230 RepID=UPI00305717AD
MRILRKVFNRRIALTLLALALVVAVAVLVNVVGIELAGDIPSWSHWLKNNAPVFFVWRIFLYAATVYGWLWMRKRVLQREETLDARKRLKRVEICAAASIVLLEVANFLGQS